VALVTWRLSCRGAEVLTAVVLSARIAQEQAALRRVATPVARPAPPKEVFSAVTEEVGRLLGAHLTILGRYDADGAQTVVGAWSSSGGTAAFSVDTRVELAGRYMAPAGSHRP
jgi:GAF domain-containing protein